MDTVYYALTSLIIAALFAGGLILLLA